MAFALPSVLFLTSLKALPEEIHQLAQRDGTHAVYQDQKQSTPGRRQPRASVTPDQRASSWPSLASYHAC